MLAADKDRLVAALKQNALALRQKELDYYVERYSNIATQASIVAGFAFDSLVELEISDDMRAALAPGGRWKAELRWMETVYYGSASLTMALALYTVCVASFATVYGHRLALQGPTGSVERAVAVMMKQRHSIFVTYGLSLLSLVVAAITMSWIKMGVAATFVSGIFLALLLGLVRKHQQMKALFRIPQEHMVQGDVRLFAGAEHVDVSRLEAGFGEAASAPTGGGPPHDQGASPPPPLSPGLPRSGSSRCGGSATASAIHVTPSPLPPAAAPSVGGGSCSPSPLPSIDESSRSGKSRGAGSSESDARLPLLRQTAPDATGTQPLRSGTPP
mmetsp:Transcript_14215/g.45542  ORF Transcript_14215/g.45542 Transcript_14215/m.45542 type:complete len:330 (+) Transcript_14215:164-1153(+)